MLSVQTDMEIPKDLSGVRVEVSVYGTLLHGQYYAVGPSGLKIPATLGIVAGKDPATPVTIRVIGMYNGMQPRTISEVVTTVPHDRVALLRIPIQWLCDEHVKEPSAGQFATTCSQGQSCKAGKCVDMKLDSSLLMTYSPQSVYGGAMGPGMGGKCLDTVLCFSKGYEAAFDPLDCSLEKPPDGDGLNVALLQPPGGPGICGPQGCLIPFDQDPEYGWQLQGERIVLPAAACERVLQGKAKGVAVTTACPTKTPAIPTCGPWSSVDTPGEFDAGGPDALVLVDAGDGGQGGADGADGADEGGAGTQADASDDAADGAPDPFSCVGKVQWTQPSATSYTLTLTLKDIVTDAPAEGTYVRACPKSDYICANSVDEGMTGPDGVVQLVVNPSVDGVNEYFELAGDTVTPTLLYLYFTDPSVFEAGQFTARVFSWSTLTAAATAVGITPNANAGHLALTARDCFGQPAAGIALSTAPDIGKLFYAENHVLSSTATQTDGFGEAMVFDAMPQTSPVTVLGTIVAGSQLLGKVPVVIRLGYVTSTNVVPTP